MTIKKTILVSTYILLGLLVLVALAYIFLGTRTSQQEMTVECAEGMLFDAPLDGEAGFVTVAPGLRFRIDTGSDMSYITPEDLALLDSMGYKVEKKFYPAIGRNTLGKYDYALTRYRVDFPAYCWSDDSIPQPIEDTKNVFHNVDFAVSPSDFSVLGIDFLENFMVEHRVNTNSIALYKELAPVDYEQCQVIERRKSPLLWPLMGHRYYVNMAVSHNTSRYFIDSGMRGAFMKLPMADTDNSITTYMDTTMCSFIGEFPAKLDVNTMIQIGTRQGQTGVYYFDSTEEPYATNPFNMQGYNMVIDFPNRRLLFRE